MKKLLLTLLFTIAISFSYAEADWQTKLEENFDIVETFDQLQDWTGTGNGNVSGNPDDMPKKLDGTPSIWQYYSFYGDSYDQKWIGNHGSNNVWKGKGKSLNIDYNCAQGQAVDGGPSRLGFKIGDSPSDGYPDEVHVFFMTRIDKDFFIVNDDNTFRWFNFLKILEVASGFKSVESFGTDAEHNWLASKGAGANVLATYGLNAQVFNYQIRGGNTSNLVIRETVLVPNTNIQYGSSIFDYVGVVIANQVLNSAWFGLEYRIKMSKPHGAYNGECEIWLYDPSGNEIGHHLRTGYLNFKDGNTVFNHSWNKFVIGGNRECAPVYNEAFGQIDNLYIDDIVINGSRIGQKYFSLLQTPPSPVEPNTKGDVNEDGVVNLLDIQEVLNIILRR